MSEEKGYQLQFHRAPRQIGDVNESLLAQFQSHLTHALVSQRLPLPPDIFVGRQAEIEQMMMWLQPASAAVASEKSLTRIVAIAGRAGVGKSALAAQIAHRMKPDLHTQLYANLRGENQPIAPTQILAGFLRAWGVNDSLMPEDLVDRSRLFRSIAARKRPLILLDDASDAAQVQPLIPTSFSCVLITSRKRFTDLPAAHLLDLAELSELDAIDLLKQIVGVSAAQAELDVLRAIELCDRLPLCLHWVAKLLRQHPQLRLNEVVDRLAKSNWRLKQLQLSYPEVRASFSLSYEQLEPTAARLLRSIGLLSEATFQPTTAAVLLGCSIEVATEAIKPLLELELVEPIDRGRYRIAHDLVRFFIRGQLAAAESAEARQQVRLNLSQHYLQICELMNVGLDPSLRSQGVLTVQKRSKHSASALERSLFLGALNWFEAERLNLVAAVEWAYQAEAWETTVLLADRLVSFFDIRTYWADWEHTHQFAIEAARKLSDRQTAQTFNNLGNLYLRQGNWDKSQECYSQSLELWGRLKLPEQEARSLMNLGILCAMQNQFQSAFAFWNTALTKLSADAPESLLIKAWMHSSTGLSLQRVETYFGDRPSTRGVIRVLGGLIEKLLQE